MVNSNVPHVSAARGISKVLLDQAKRLWVFALACNIFGPIFGLVCTFASLLPVVAPILLVILAAAGEALQWRSDALKDDSEAVKREEDLADSLGWLVPDGLLRDLRAEHLGLLKAFSAHASDKPYFESKEPPGVKRAAQNLEESSWWSKHLSQKMGLFCALVVLALIAIAVFALLYSLEAVKEAMSASNVETLHMVGNVVTASFTLMFSLGLVRLAVSYFTFSNKAGKIEEQSRLLLSHVAEASDMDVARLWQRYHLARATAPLIPTRLWNWLRDDLNAVWQQRDT